MKVNSQLKGAQLELVDDCPANRSKGKITYNTECQQVQVSNGTDCHRLQDDRDMPVGSVIIWVSPIAPPNPFRWQKLDGSSVSTATFPELFAVLGYSYGGTGNSFTLPDFRGEFLRGTDSGSNRDPNRNQRTNRGDGTVGNNIGTKQADEFESHNHSYTDTYIIPALDGDNDNDHDTFNRYTTAVKNTAARGGLETRPRNIYVDYYIKVK